MELEINMNTFEMLSFDAMMSIDGGVDLGWIGSGIAVVGAGCFAIICAPASAFVGAAYIGTLACSAAVGAGAGLMIGQGLIS